MSTSRRELLGLAKAATLPGNVVVCIFQRGAADGLNSVVPYGDSNYYLKRPRIAVPKPGSTDGAINLNGFFGLHPSLAPLKSLYDTGELAIVHAAGVPHGTRSHAEAQRRTESGVATSQTPGTGWIGRYLSSTFSSSDRPLRAIAVGSVVPLTMTGAPEPQTITSMTDFGLGSFNGTTYQTTLGALYAPDRPWSGIAQSALAAMNEIIALKPTTYVPENSAAYPTTDLGPKLSLAAQLIKANLGTQVICVDSGGWDHHENLPANLAASLDVLAKSLVAFRTDLGTQMSRVTVVVMTEFGRRVADNASNGTDHGTAGCLYLLGGGVNGGQVVGRWPGLATAQLTNSEDLAITTDTRDVLLQCLQRRLGNATAATLFPGFTPGSIGELFLAA